ncbi:hypothetical protein AGLY_009159 [Aphis glycines]|uniref:Uncharacterized protein n=1 Tax=Aphis glycines TaxID=307491 RepID=A0A6G0TJ40_APHGL|nr:hypothetical protein AGLY_009159 [Aphis glycines]
MLGALWSVNSSNFYEICQNRENLQTIDIKGYNIFGILFFVEVPNVKAVPTAPPVPNLKKKRRYLVKAGRPPPLRTFLSVYQSGLGHAVVFTVYTLYSSVYTIPVHGTPQNIFVNTKQNLIKLSILYILITDTLVSSPLLSLEREIGKWKYHSTNYQGEIFVLYKLNHSFLKSLIDV